MPKVYFHALPKRRKGLKSLPRGRILKMKLLKTLAESAVDIEGPPSSKGIIDVDTLKLYTYMMNLTKKTLNCYNAEDLRKAIKCLKLTEDLCSENAFVYLLDDPPHSFIEIEPQFLILKRYGFSEITFDINEN